MEKSNILSAFMGLSKIAKAIACIAILLVIAIIVIGIFGLGKGNGLTTVSESSLREVIEINELSTVEYTYNAIATKYNDDRTKALYHVAYEGKVKAGIDFTKTEIDIEKKEKRIRITLPEAEIQGVSIDMAKLDFIFLKDKYETETISKEAYELCLSDLEASAKEQDNLLTVAKENAVSCIEALLDPWLESMGSDYMIEFIGEENK